MTNTNPSGGVPRPTSTSSACPIYYCLAAAYRRCLDRLGAVTGRTPERIVVLGGGGRNALLRAFTQEACGVPVEVGPHEATALGNALLQGVACGHIDAGDLPRHAAAASTTRGDRG